MDILSTIIIAIGLAMDCFAVSISKGICAQRMQLANTLKMAFLFGLFQALMPLIGFYTGRVFIHEMSAYDHWVAFGLLAVIGGKMLLEGFKHPEPECEISPNPFRLKTLLVLAIATSIDALASGIVFIPYPNYITAAVAIIGTVSFVFSLTGMWIGVHFGKRFNLNVEVLGGFILIGIGSKILIEHLFFNS